eukprot:CAMPEP_0172903158 /NCGR_PEP_ID=MMETSP1075-20121228/169910_1 /TAXON_ID=2916 /ORGANISM="Ceratium fusus, Strain PA161109" /LENGTH=322 /DNA_ID=CAMNT_0013759901 /DNA_START=90 /DNA_END=1054 /DNA_ORIENTATION=+
MQVGRLCIKRPHSCWMSRKALALVGILMCYSIRPAFVPGASAGLRIPGANRCQALTLRCLASAAPSGTLPDIKAQILQIAALTDRGQRLNTLIAPTYQDKREQMTKLVDSLTDHPCDVSEATLSGEWELVYSSVELFRSSPFFLAIEEALNSSPDVPLLGEWLGVTDPSKKAEVFFKLHQLQVLSWGASTVGRIAQRVDFKASTLESSFDTVIFGLTVIPVLGWFKLLPTFGGRVVTEADGLKLSEDGALCMELQRTKVTTCPGVERIPFVDRLLMDFWYPVNSVWKLLPWNGGPFDGRAPSCRMSTLYVDETMRVSRDGAG